jgi:hypothetical protein
MSYPATVFKVMIASPTDVAVERNIVREVLTEWNVVHADTRRIVLLPVGWEAHSVPEMRERPQSLINKQVLQESDLLIGIFWTRIGTATDLYPSGSVEEIEEHIKTGRPAMLYFSDVPVILGSVDDDQHQKVKAFRSSCQSRRLCESYVDMQDFRAKLDRQLQLKVNNDPHFKTATETAFLSPVKELPVAPSLTEEGEFLLKWASDHNAKIHYLEEGGGAVLLVGGKNLIEQGNERSRATWVSALQELEAKRLIIALGSKRETFKITREGFAVADRLP